MYRHVKKLMYTVRVDEPDPKLGNMLLEQFGGATGELAAAMQYFDPGLEVVEEGKKKEEGCGCRFVADRGGSARGAL